MVVGVKKILLSRGTDVVGHCLHFLPSSFSVHSRGHRLPLHFLSTADMHKHSWCRRWGCGWWGVFVVAVVVCNV